MRKLWTWFKRLVCGLGYPPPEDECPLCETGQATAGEYNGVPVWYCRKCIFFWGRNP